MKTAALVCIIINSIFALVAYWNDEYSKASYWMALNALIAAMQN